MNLKKHLLTLVFSVFSLFAMAQTVSVSPNTPTGSACHGDTAFVQIQISNTSGPTLTIDSIVAPTGFGRKGTYPISVPASTLAGIDFYHEGSTVGQYTDTFLVYSNAANRPRPFKIGVTLTIMTRPTAIFSINDSDQCVNLNSYTFTNSSTISSGTIATYDWFFGDGGTSSATSPTKSYILADTFDVTLYATSDLNCLGIATKQVIVFPAPDAKIDNNNTFLCFKNHQIDFVDSTKISSGTFTSKWFFGDGDSSTQSSLTHVYPKDSTYRVKLISTSNQGCIDRDSQDITINPTPIVLFNVNDSDQCLNGNSYTFTNNSTINTGSISTYSWSFGDATVSSATSPTKTYTAAGAKTVRLIATSDLNCNDTLTKQVMVYRKPTPSFTVNDSTQCLEGNSFGFTNASTIGGTDTMFYSWTFGDGGTSTDTNDVYTYTNFGTYSVKLVATSNNGCADSVSKTSIVYAQPSAAFSVNDTDQCLNNQNFIFTNNSSIPAGTIAGYSWRFGNGDTSDQTSPTKNDYSIEDSVLVRLIIRSDEGCYDTANQEMIIFPKPVLQFGVADTTQCFNNNVFVFNDNSNITYGTLNYNWTFGDGGTSAAADTNYTYGTFSTLYPIGLTVTSDNGCVATGTDSVYLFPNPVADFIIVDSAKCFRGNSFSFLDNSSITTGSYTTFWRFGNSDTSSQTNPFYSYNFSDTFNVLLTVTSDLGCEDSLTKKTIVFPHPSTNYTVNRQEQCFVGHQFNFRDTSTITYGTLTYNWDFGDGSSITGNTTPSKLYAAPDTFDITYTVTSDQGCDSTVTGQVFLQPSPANVGFTTNDTTQCINGNSFIYTNTTTVSAGTLNYTWTLGNGSTIASRNATISYLAPDTLNVKMVVRTDRNCSDSATQTVYIFPKPTVSFAVNDPIQCFNGNSFTFTNASTIAYGTLTYDWNLGDGNSSTQTSLSHSYANADTFDIVLIATSDQGCADTITRKAYVHPVPVADFVVNDSIQCIKSNTFQFTDNTIIQSGNINYSWNFGDFSGASIQNPSHIYTQADTFVVRLIATSNNSCKDTISKNVYVTPSPDPSFLGLAPQFCVNGTTVTLTPVAPGGTFSGDNISGNQFSPVQIGWNTVKYVVELSAGCKDSLTDSTLVVPIPVVDLGLDTVLCAEDFYTLNVFTLGGAYKWSDSTDESSFRITKPGLHWVIVTNACGTYSDSVTAEYLDFPCDAFIPNAFTPEGNTVNDFFGPLIDTTIVKGIEFVVFSRWGNKIFETRDVHTLGWDGYHNGKPAPEGVYGYLLKMTILREDVRILKQVKGNFHLLR